MGCPFIVYFFVHFGIYFCSFRLKVGQHVTEVELSGHDSLWRLSIASTVVSCNEWLSILFLSTCRLWIDCMCDVKCELVVFSMRAVFVLANASLW